MPKNLTGNAATFPTQTSPVAAEPRTAGSVETPFQNSADRTAWCKDRIEYIDPTKGGARRVRRVASIAALKALTDVTNEGVCFVSGTGLYEYLSAGAELEVSPVILQPDTGGGRWYAIALGRLALNIANGVPQLDATGKVPASLIAAGSGASRIPAATQRHTPVDVVYVHVDAQIDSSSVNVFVDVTGATVTVAALSGDILDIELSLQTYRSTGGAVSARIQVVKPDANTEIPQGAASAINGYGGSTPAYTQGVFARHICATDGNYTVKLQHCAVDGGSVSTRFVTLKVTVRRP